MPPQIQHLLKVIVAASNELAAILREVGAHDYLLDEQEIKRLLREREIFLEERKLFLEERKQFARERERFEQKRREEIVSGSEYAAACKLWYDNPLDNWRYIKAAMLRGEPVRVADGDLRFCGYLFRRTGNQYLIVKYGKPQRLITFAELMGLCLSGQLVRDDQRWEMPQWYKQFL